MEGVVEAQRPASLIGRLHDGLKVLAEQVFHGKKIGPFQAPEIIDLDDVLVLKKCGQLGLVDEGFDQVFLLHEMGQELLDGNQFLKTLVPDDLGPIELGHPANGNLIQEEIFTEFFGMRIIHHHKIMQNPSWTVKG
jgi:hypothetical protein